MTRPIHSVPFLKTARLASLFACGILAMGSVTAQPTGNPKGTGVPPAEGLAQKSPAGGRPASAGDTSNGPLTSESGPASARMRRTEPPGGGTAGGLTNRPLTAPEPASRSTTDKGSAGQRPVSPSGSGTGTSR
jgi:hypothetical protein